MALSRLLGSILEFGLKIDGELSEHRKQFRAPRLFTGQGDKVVKHVQAVSGEKAHCVDVHGFRKIQQLFAMSVSDWIYSPKKACIVRQPT